ncbi:hypothetical protein [Legionella spiritensis]|uniref:Ankyrin repeat protein n=1 Tax=Legionella spiritensis TaxID=452 RepID=A0A0W0YXP4_LEGSP|nr:hypothetical protein [Legionella spiritensis]KTD61595.1 Ankyrin repeat protein [Legionella spiritensis]SNV39513.1 Ankyrin repeat protein [Legionella spiritensis]
MGRDSNTRYTTFADSPLNGWLNRLHLKILDLQNEYPEEPGSLELTYSRAQTDKLLEIVNTIKDDLIPLYENGKKPGLWDLKSKLGKFRELLANIDYFSTIESRFYNAIETHFSQIITDAIATIAIREFTCEEDIGKLKTQMKIELHKNSEERFAAVMEIPNAPLEELFVIVEQLIDDYDFNAFLDKKTHKIDQKKLAKDLLSCVNSQLLRDRFPLDFLVCHPIMYKWVMDLLSVLQDMPDELARMLTFLDPEAPDIDTRFFPLVFTYAGTKDAPYTYKSGFRGFTKVRNLENTYRELKPTLKNILFKQLKRYLTFYKETSHVQDEIKKGRVMRAFATLELQQQTNTLSSHESAIIRLSEERIAEGMVLSEKQEVLGKHIDDIDKQIKAVREDIISFKQRMTSYDERTLNDLISVYPELKEESHSESSPDSSYLNEGLPKYLIVYDDGKNDMEEMTVHADLNQVLTETIQKAGEIKKQLVSARAKLIEEARQLWQEDYDEIARQVKELASSKKATVLPESGEEQIEAIAREIEENNRKKSVLQSSAEMVETRRGKMSETPYSKDVSEPDWTLLACEINDQLQQIFLHNQSLHSLQQKIEEGRRFAEEMSAVNPEGINEIVEKKQSELSEKQRELEENQGQLTHIALEQHRKELKLQQCGQILEESPRLISEKEKNIMDKANRMVALFMAMSDLKPLFTDYTIRFTGSLQASGIQEHLGYHLNRWECAWETMSSVFATVDFEIVRGRHDWLRQILIACEAHKEGIPFSSIAESYPFQSRVSRVKAIFNKTGKSEEEIWYELLQLLDVDPEEIPGWVAFRKQQAVLLKKGSTAEVSQKMLAFEELVKKRIGACDFIKDITSLRQYGEIRGELTAEHEALSRSCGELKLLDSSIDTARREQTPLEETVKRLVEQKKRIVSDIDEQTMEIRALRDNVDILTLLASWQTDYQALNKDILSFGTDSDRLVESSSSAGISHFYNRFRKLRQAFELVSRKVSDSGNDKNFAETLRKLTEGMKQTLERMRGAAGRYYNSQFQVISEKLVEIQKELQRMEDFPPAIEFMAIRNGLDAFFKADQDFTDEEEQFDTLVDQIKELGDAEMIPEQQAVTNKQMLTIASHRNTLRVSLFEETTRVFGTMSETLDEHAQRLRDLEFNEDQATLQANGEVTDNIAKFLNAITTEQWRQMQFSLEQLKPASDDSLEELATIQVNLQELRDSYDRKQGILDGVAERYLARKEWAIQCKSSLDAYLTERKNKYGVKDMVNASDSTRRLELVRELKGKLDEYSAHGDSTVVSSWINDHYAMVPGRRLQSLLSRIMVGLYANEQAVPEDYLAPEHILPLPDHNEALGIKARISNEQLKGCMRNLYDKIDLLKTYGETISNDDHEAGQTAIDLSEQLQRRVDAFVITHQETLQDEDPGITQKDFDLFRNGFRHLLHSQDDNMSHHRTWGPLIGNVFLAVSTLGIALGVQLLVSKWRHGHASCFFSDTHRNKLVDDVDKALTNIPLSVCV